MDFNGWRKIDFVDHWFHDGVIKRLVYDGNNVQLETDDVGDLLVDNTYVPNKYGMALSQRRDGDSSFYLADGTQDVRQLTDSVQSVTDEYEFDAWGNSLSSTGGTPNAQQYKGQQLAYRADPDAGPELQYALHFRQYDPHTARFTSRDPAEDDLNLYRYVKNNPVNNVDPSGLDPTRDALDVVDQLLTVEVLKLKFLGGLAYGVFVNELWGTAVDAVEGAGSQIKAAVKLGSFVARSIYGYYTGDTDAMRAAEDAAIEQFTTVEQAAEFFEQAGPTMAAIFSDIAPNGTLDGLEPETIAFIEAIKPELEEIQGILVTKWQKATPEDIAWKLGEIVAPILLGAATMGVGMVAQGGKLSAAVAKVKKTLGRLGLDEKNAQRVVELANRIFGKLKTIKQKVSGKRTGNGDNRPRGHSVEQANELDSPGPDMHQPDGTKEGPAQTPKPENGNGSLDAHSLPDPHAEPVAPKGAIFGMGTGKAIPLNAPRITTGPLHTQAVGLLNDAARLEGRVLTELVDEVAVVPRGVLPFSFTHITTEGNLAVFFREEDLLGDVITSRLTAQHELGHLLQTQTWQQTLGTTRLAAFEAYFSTFSGSTKKLAPIEVLIEERAWEVVRQNFGVSEAANTSHRTFMEYWEKRL